MDLGGRVADELPSLNSDKGLKTSADAKAIDWSAFDYCQETTSLLLAEAEFTLVEPHCCKQATL